MSPLSLIFGAVVGLSLGLTGGGGAIFAVPLLVYGIGLPAKEATAVSLAAVGATSLVGFLYRWRRGEVEPRTGMLFAIAGMVGAPIGTWVASLLSEQLLLLLFAGLMLVVATKMWRNAAAAPAIGSDGCYDPDAADGSACRRDPAGLLILTTRCAAVLLLVGVVTGALAGLFGVGGGFVIVPALIFFSNMSIHRAVGTSLMVIALVSASGLASQFASGQGLPVEVTLLFVSGGIAGLFLGQRLAKQLSGDNLQRVFAVAIVMVAAFVILRNLTH